MARAGIFGSARVAGGPGSPVTFQGSAVDTSDQSSYTFAARPIGAPSATRRVVVALASRIGRAVSSATIGGVSATVDVDQSASSNRVTFISAVVPSGTTADVSVTFASSTSRCGIGVWTLAAGSPTGQTSTASGDPAGLAVTTVAGQVVIAAAMINSAGTSFSWAGATERYDELVETLDIFHTGADVVASGVSTVITVDASPGASGLVAAAAAYA